MVQTPSTLSYFPKLSHHPKPVIVAHHTDKPQTLKMDSMRSLNSSLPRSPRRRRSNPPPEQLIQTFKAAALSVTNLYKTAAADQARAREAGYQDALDDVLAFLDKENLGLDDGEGWKVRQWATERLDGSPLQHTVSDNDEDRGETVNRTRSSSPIVQRAAAPEATQARQSSRSNSPTSRTKSAPPAQTLLEPPNTSQQPSEIFTFRSTPPYSLDIDMQPLEGSNTNTTANSLPQPQLQATSASPAVRVEVLPRGSRPPHRGSRHNNKATGGVRTLGAGAGSKRGFKFGDYEFDFGGVGDGKDGTGGGGKRGRYA